MSAQKEQSDLTMMFVDLERSTRLIQELGDGYKQVLVDYRKLLRSKVAQFLGAEVDTIGDGYFAVFCKAEHALYAALDIQQGMEATRWPNNNEVRARIGLHKGNVQVTDDTYVGLDVHIASRIGDSGNGGQIILSLQTFKAIDQILVAQRCSFRDLGAHRLKGLRYPEILYDAVPVGRVPSSSELRTMDSRPNNLPQEAVALIGRASELKELSSLLTGEQYRLVTVTGAGGIGKTSFALETAKNLLPDFPAGVFVVELSGIDDPRLVTSEILQTVGIRESTGKDSLESLTIQLRKAHMLLLIDNFEHVIEAREVVRSLIKHCPALRILVTSRESLGLPSERIFPLDCLTYPRAEELENMDKIAASPAVQLFVERSKLVRPEFDLSKQNARAVAEICRRLDGLALGIELAASRIKILSPQQLLDRLSQSDIILKGGAERQERHRTLEAAIEWSYRMLKPEEQALLHLISIFSGGMLLESIETICSDLTWLEAEPLEVLTSLLDKSLVRSTQVNGEIRLGLLEPIRQFAIQRLKAEGNFAEASEKHGMYYIHLAESLAPFLQTSRQKIPVNRLYDELDNLRESLAWSLQSSDTAHCRRGMQSLLWFWIGRGLFTEAISWVDKGLAYTEEKESDYDTACLADVGGWLRIMMGDWEGALPLCKKAHDLYRDHGDPLDIARTKISYGLTLAVLGDVAIGSPMIREALEIYRAHHEPTGTAWALIAIGEGVRSEGDLQGARELYLEALRIFEACDNVFWPCGIFTNLAHFHLIWNDQITALKYAAKAWEYAREYEYPTMTALATCMLGGIELMSEQPENAARLLGLTQKLLLNMGAHFEPLDRAAYEHYVDLTREQLGGEQRYRVLEAQGMGMSLVDANDYVVRLKNRILDKDYVSRSQEMKPLST